MSDAQEKVIRIRLDTTQVQSDASKITGIIGTIGQNPSGLAEFNSQLDGLSKNARAAGVSVSAANDNFESMKVSTGHASEGILDMVKHLATMSLALAGIGFVTEGLHALAEAFIETSDHATEVTARILSFTTGAKQAADAQAQIVAIANQTRAALPEVAELYSKIGIQSDHLGLSLTQVGLATKVFTETSKLSGSTAQQQKSAMLQLGEALDIGTLNGRHFLAMMQDNIVFMRLLANSMNVPVGSLRALSTAGKVTAAELTKALTDPKMVAMVEQQFGRLPVSFSDVRTGIHNTLIQLAGDFASGAGLNTSLAMLYANISQLGTNLKPTFEKIGVAVKAAFSEFAPIFEAALAAIKPAFNFVLDNAPALIQLAKVATEAWIAYRVATAALAGVNLASKFMTEASSLAAFMKAANGGGTIMSYLRAGLESVAGGFDVLKAAIMANPLVALAVGITAVVALLYEFRDSINLGGDSMATLGDLMRAVWNDVGPAIEKVVDWVSSGFSKMGGYVDEAMSTIASLFGDTFSGFDFSITGALRFVAQFADTMITLFKDCWTLVTTIWNNFPAFLQMVFTSAANLGIAAMEFLENKTIGIINSIIGAVNSVSGSKISLVADVKLPKLDEGTFAKTLQTNLAGNKTLGAETGLDSLLKQADAIGAARRNVAQPAGPSGNAMKTLPGGDTSTDKDAAKRAKQEKEFWQTLQDELSTSKLYGIQLTEQTEENKLQKILGADITADQRSRIDSMVQQIANQKAVTTLNQAAFEAQNKYTLELQKGSNLTAGQKAVEDELFKYRLDALNKGADINTSDYKTAEAKLATILKQNQALVDQVKNLKDAETFAKKYSAGFDAEDLQKQLDNFNKEFAAGKLMDAFGKPLTQTTHDAIVSGATAAMDELKTKDFKIVADYTGAGSTAAQTLAIKTENDKYNEAKNYLNTLDLTPQARNEISADIEKAHVAGMAKATSIVADQFRDDMTSAISELANIFGGSFGDVLNKFGSVIKSIQGSANGTSGLAKLATDISPAFGSGFVDSSKSMLDISGGIKDLKTPLNSLVKGFDPQSGGSFLKGMGQAVGGALAGAQEGSAIGGMMGMLGIQHAGTGATIGGAIGGITGNPVISAITSVVGGLIGSLLYKPPTSTANFTTDSSGNVTVGDVVGSNSTVRGQANDAAGQVITGLQSIADQLGGKLTGAPNESIGTFNNEYRVQDSKTSESLNYNNFSASTLHDFGTDEASAITYAIGKALNQGVITGLPSIVEKALQQLDQDSALSFAQNYATAMANLKQITDPVGAAVDGVLDPLQDLIDTMTKLGATSQEMASMQQLQQEQLKAALKQETATITDFIKSLTGEGSGQTDYSRLTTDLSSFKDYQSQIAGGATDIDQSAFSALGQEIMSLAGNVYGTSTSQFQSIIAMLTDSSNTLLNNIDTAFGADATAKGVTMTGSTGTASTTDTTTAAINDQTSAVVGQLTIMTGQLQQLIDGGGGTTIKRITTLNGKVAA